MPNSKSHSMAQLNSEDWDFLFQQQPLLQHSFLAAFEASDCVNARTGWQPQHLIHYNEHDKPVSALPLYLKAHSYGEYVFDWSWADASHRAGLAYYPKLISALPFTPTTSARLGRTTDTKQQHYQQLLSGLMQQLEQHQASSWHLLFGNQGCLELIEKNWPGTRPLLKRHDCQYHWFNESYDCFDDFLNRLTSRKRKNLRKERIAIKHQGVSCQRLLGNQLTPELINEFYHFYQHTYHQRGQQPYLNPVYFNLLLKALRDNLLLITAQYQNQLIGAALFIFDDSCLYGRWWGGSSQFNALHFEACYYQGIEFAIEKKLRRFDPGTQGEHKLIRGFRPVKTTSLHWLQHPALYKAVDNALAMETKQVEHYIRQAERALPYKNKC